MNELRKTSGGQVTGDRTVGSTTSASPSRVPPVVFVCEGGQDHFIRPVVEKLKSSFNVPAALFIVDDRTLSLPDVAGNSVDLLAWILSTEIAPGQKPEVVWLEWLSPINIHLVRALSRIDDPPPVLLRLHSYEYLNGFHRTAPLSELAGCVFVCDHVIESVLSEIQDMPGGPPLSSVIPNGVDMSRISFRAREWGPRLGMLCNINAKKGLQTAAMALSFLRSHSKGQPTLKIAGSVQDRRFSLYLEHYAKKLGDGLNLDGFTSSPLSWLDQNVDQLLVTSPWEGHPVGVIEAMAMGIRPLIHFFPGADDMYPPELLWKDFDELLERYDDPHYDSASYHNHVLRSGWTLPDQCQKIVDFISLVMDHFAGSAKNERACPADKTDTDRDRVPSAQAAVQAGESPPGSPPFPDLDDFIRRAVSWIKNNAVPSGDGHCVPVRVPGLRVPYPEVTGYMIPTLLSLGEGEFAHDLLKGLLVCQNPDGGFPGPRKGESIVFDTAQVLRGFLAFRDEEKVREPMSRAVEYLVRNIKADGGWAPHMGPEWEGPGGRVDSAIYAYAFKPFVDALSCCRYDISGLGEKLDHLRGILFPRCGFDPDNNILSHFWFYVVEAAFENGFPALGQGLFDRWPIVDSIVRGRLNEEWICIPGQFQAAHVALRYLGDLDLGRRLFFSGRRFQTYQGGFYGSAGSYSGYFYNEEIAWPLKFALDCVACLKGSPYVNGAFERRKEL